MISVAVGALDHDPPDWFADGIADEDKQLIASASRPRRKRELLWSRGLKARLRDRFAQARPASAARAVGSGPGFRPRYSISHDKNLTAVAMSEVGGLGVDLQSDCSVLTARRIAKAWFPPQERDEIVDQEDCGRFLQSWVVKESWAKCLNRSVFQACREIGYWRGRVRARDAGGPPLAIAWARHHFGPVDLAAGGSSLASSGPAGGAGVGFAMGLCLSGAGAPPAIRSFLPDEQAALRGVDIDWQWLALASREHGR